MAQVFGSGFLAGWTGEATVRIVLGLLVVSVAVLLFVAWWLGRRLAVEKIGREMERRRREEMEAYEHLDPELTASMAAGLNPVDTTREMAKQVCRTVAEMSAFPAVALLLKNAEGRFYGAGSCGVDDLTMTALLGWGEQVALEERARAGLAAGSGDGAMHPRPVTRSGSFEAAKAGARAMAARSQRSGAKSFTIPLGAYDNYDPETSRRRMEGLRERRRARRCTVAPLRTPSGRLVGALALFADDAKWTAAMRKRAAMLGVEGSSERNTSPVEALAAKLAAAIENCGMAERLLRAEKLAGLGQLAGGVAHALNNPLTAVLGFAELIEESTTDARVQRDARTIREEARKMRATVESLLNFWRPETMADEAVMLGGVVRELAEACEQRLAQRGIRLEVTVPAELPPVRGSRERVRLLLEHLLNNAAEAIGQAQSRPENGDEDHAIRVSVSHDARSLNVIVSDTGTGFDDPTRVFDPFYTTREPGEGSGGMGLSICYGIAREHGGEISAFNLSPSGAAVVVELPLRKVMAGESGERMLARAGK